MTDDDAPDLESMYRCIDCDSRRHRACTPPTPTPDTDKEPQ